jgi:hypothetical protein
MSTDPNDTPHADDIDPTELKNALGRTGRMLKTAGLPFELDEFDDNDAPDDPRPEGHRNAADPDPSKRGDDSEA